MGPPPRRTPRVAEGLTGALLAPLPVFDAASWRAAFDDATSVLAGLAVRRAGGGPFRVTDHEVRVALGGTEHRTAGGVVGGAAGGVERVGTEEPEPFAWSARTARRTLGLAAVRRLADGGARSPAEAVRTRLAESGAWVRDGSPWVSPLDRWLAGLPPAGLAAVAAQAVTWATRLWCALDWAAFPSPPVIGRDHWWDSPHSALLALRGRADVRTERAHLVVLSGPRRDSARAELALVTLVEALRGRSGDPPGRVVGWWPDSGHLVRVEPEPAVLTQGAEAVALVLTGAGTPLRSLAA
jgi:hypothetical protein